MSAVARRQDCDDVLFVSTREPHIVAVVHLTYSGRREKSDRMPWTTTFSSVQDWLARGMLADHQDIG